MSKLQKLEFKILKGDHDDKEGAVERKWKTIITKSDYKQGQKDLLDTEFLNFTYCLNVTIFKYLSINYLILDIDSLPKV